MKLWMLLLAGSLAAASCTSSNEPASTTTTTAPPSTTTTTPVSTTTSSSTTTTSTLLAGEISFPEYRIAERVVSQELGDTVVLLMDPTSYTSLSDLDIYDVIADAVDRFPPIFEAHVVDTPEAASVVLIDEPDESQQEALTDHYLARLEDGFRIVYLGPFEEAGEAVLGS